MTFPLQFPFVLILIECPAYYGIPQGEMMGNEEERGAGRAEISVCPGVRDQGLVCRKHGGQAAPDISSKGKGD